MRRRLMCCVVQLSLSRAFSCLLEQPFGREEGQPGQYTSSMLQCVPAIQFMCACGMLIYEYGLKVVYGQIPVGARHEVCNFYQAFRNLPLCSSGVASACVANTGAEYADLPDQQRLVGPQQILQRLTWLCGGRRTHTRSEDLSGEDRDAHLGKQGRQPLLSTLELAQQ